RWPVRWVYSAVLALWSATGFATGLVHGYSGLLVCRTLLGFFEAGHWPCAVKTTQRLLEPKDRSMGNSVLQSGTSIGAIITPLILRLLLTEETGSWRFAFQAIGLFGLAWIVVWFALVKSNDLTGPSQVTFSAPEKDGGGTIWKVIFSRKMFVVL